METPETDIPRSSPDDFAASVEKTKELFKAYSIEDIAKALFVSDIWLPNISSGVKHFYFVATLCSMDKEEFAQKSSIIDYKYFKEFLCSLYATAPSFVSLEDFVPEADWGEIKYAIGHKHYRVFFGGNLDDSFDYLKTFELLFTPFDEKFKQLINRVPSVELKSALLLEEAILTGIQQRPEDLKEISSGHIEVPPEDFWQAASSFYDHTTATILPGDAFFTTHSIEIGSFSKAMLTADHFGEAVSTPGHLPGFAIHDKNSFHLILPRRITEVLFDNWGELFNRHKEKLKPPDRPIDTEMYGKFFRFIRTHIRKENTFLFVSARKEDGHAHDITFPLAVRSKDRLVLFYFLPISQDGSDLTDLLSEELPHIHEALRLISVAPSTILLRGQGQGTQFSNADDTSLPIKPTLLLVAPQTSTGIYTLMADQALQGVFTTLHNIIAVLDEVTDDDQLGEFLDYLDHEQALNRSVGNSLLDHFASFIDSSGVLNGGAIAADMITLDPNWGSRYRYNSLRSFWNDYPGTDFADDPRTWILRKEGTRRIRLIAKSYFGSVLQCHVGDTHVFFTAPFHHMKYEAAKTSDFIMQCAEDNIYRFSELLKNHPAFRLRDQIVITIFPSSLPATDPQFAHLKHLNPGDAIWKADSGFPDERAIGVRLVYNEEKVQEGFTQVTDRSLEVALTSEIIRQIDAVYPDATLEPILQAIGSTKSGAPRYKFAAFEKLASFPEHYKPWMPEPRHFKLAKKRIAELALAAGVNRGKYDLEAGKKIINTLKSAMVAEIDRITTQFNLRTSIEALVRNADAVTNELELARLSLRSSYAHEVDYDRAEAYTKNDHKFVVMHKNYRYLIEKFTQISPSGSATLNNEAACNLLAFVDWLLVMYGASDSIHYDIDSASLIINHEYIAEVEYSAQSLRNHDIFEHEHANTQLGQTGNPSDRISEAIPIAEQQSAFDSAFLKDYNFDFTSLVSILKILSAWPLYKKGVKEAPSYRATLQEIEEVATTNIKGLDRKSVKAIVKFLTLRPHDVIRLLNDPCACPDIPVWEHNKRYSRYTTRPLIKIGTEYLWGPYAARNSGLLWAGSPSTAQLPAAIGKNAINAVIQDFKARIDRAVELQALSIVQRHSKHAIGTAELHKIDPSGNHSLTLGDYDVLAYIPEKHSILNIECKNISRVYCQKDARRLREKVFGIPGKHKGHFEKIDLRQSYLKEHWACISQAAKWPLRDNTPPTIRSLYVCPRIFIWTRFPPIPVETTFVRLDRLSEYIDKL